MKLDRSIVRGCLLFALLAAHVCCGEALFGAKLYGGGTSSITPLMDGWLRSYAFVRDDIGLNYTQTGSTQALADYGRGKLDFIVLDKAISPELSPLYNDLIQFPLVGQAQVMTYNIPELLPSDPNLIFDRTTLALIQMGNITQWNDERIMALNPELQAKLPARPIVVGYTDMNSAASATEVWKQALESFSSEFRDMFREANRTFALMPPALRGSGLPVPIDREGRIEWIKTHEYGLMMLGVGAASGQGIQWANMINKAGNLVKPEAASTQAAMVDFSSHYKRNNFGIDIFDGSGDKTWPLSFITFFSIQRNLSVFDCTAIQELLYFVSWIYTNDATSQCAHDRGYAPLAQFLRVRLIDWLSTVQCNGQRALSSQYLIGTGAPLSLHTAWSVAYSSGEVKVKYFVATAVEARENMADFVASNNGADLDMRSLVPDVAFMPATAVAIAPGYNLPELDDGPSLVLDYAAIAGILTNNITMWNDQRIKDLNPPLVANALPAQPITIIAVIRDPSTPQFGPMVIVSAVLRPTLPEFEGFDDTRLPTNASRWTGVPGSSASLSLLMTTPYSFAILPSYELLSTRGLGAASIRKPSGHVVQPSAESVRSTIDDQVRGQDGVDLSYNSLTRSQAREQSWPFTTFSSFIYRSSSMQDCAKAKALAEYLYWTQTDSMARQISERQGYVPLNTVPQLSRLFYNLLKNFTCKGKPVSAYYNCIDDGMLCSGVGMCSNNSCVCPAGKCGAYCGEACSGRRKDNVPVILGAVFPASVILLALITTVITVVVIVRRRNMDRDWEISYDELDVREQLGVGGYGEVHKAFWKGTEVAVKVMASGRINKEMEKSFKQEVRLMTTLRHPHVVLFMAASIKPPKMCIVMEYMSLGSLYDLLHNELIGEIPFELKAKMAYQGAKGMHFLHSSGIVHRDLKSLNLLLDAKWNVKVSDFGLTKFKEDVEKHRPDRNGCIAGSIHWTAPELINQSPCVDLTLADVYSFGIILWELLTRQQPYGGMSHAAVAVAVIRDGIRPRMPDNIEELCTLEYAELMAACWHQSPAARPAFLEIMCSLSAMFESESSSDRSNAPSDLSCAAQPPSTIIVDNEGDEEDGDEDDEDGDDTIDEADDGSRAQEEDEGEASDGSAWPDKNTTMSSVKARVAAEQLRLMTKGYGAEGQRETKKGRRKKAKKKTKKKTKKGRKEAQTVPPEGSDVTIVFADITRAASLWEYDPESMRDATILYNATLRKLLHKHDGYEALARCHDDNNTGEGSFCMAFAETADALEWCMAVQRKLLQLPWPDGLLAHPGAAEEEHEGELLFRGLRVRMGVHVGSPRVTTDPMSLRGTYAGPVVDGAARITAVAHGGQILMSKATLRQVQDVSLAGERDRIVSLGRFTIPGLPEGSGQKLYELTVRGLEARLFGDICQGCLPTRYQVKVGDEDARGRCQLTRKHVATEEDCFLNSANLCRWVIEADDLQLDEQLGMGSYGIVYRARWKGINVAVKRFVRQKLDERLMLEFRAEVAILSELHHPNVVLFIGACVKKPNLCLVTEFVKQGSLKDILLNPTIKLPLEHKLKLLHSAALGIHYLHSLHPAIIHRDLKSSNLLVDENWNVKVSDFGFARIKDENQTMTPQTGSPCWTSPEVLLGKRYNEKADIYSYGVVMWEVVARRQPYCGRHFLTVSLDVIAGKRPPLPADCPPGLRDLIQRCWQSDAAARPGMDEVLTALETMMLLAQHRDSETRTSL